MKNTKLFISNFRFLIFSLWIIISASIVSFLFISSPSVSAAVLDPVALAAFTGEATNTWFGSDMSSGDINNDGYTDIVVGASFYNSQQGRAYIFYGSDVNTPNRDAGEADTMLTGNSAQNFGETVEVSDINHDGYDDVMVGSRNYNSGQGRVYIFFGSASGIASKGSSSADITLTGEAGVGITAFGGSRSLSNSGDVNGDGYEDIIVGAYYYNSNKGRAYIFYGSASGIASKDAGQADVILTGENTADWFGFKVSSTGDVNGDGYDDVIVGAYYYNTDHQGRAYIFYGSASGIASRGAGEADVVLTGEAGSRFGGSVAGVDLNHDGFSDAVVSAYNYGPLIGRAYVFYGSASGIVSREASLADVVITGEGTSGNLGYSLSLAGDVNNDGYEDLVIGARYYSGINRYSGRAYIFYDFSPETTFIGAESADVIVTGDSAWVLLGDIVSAAGDVDNDGWKEFSAGNYTYSSWTGIACLYNLDYGSPTITVADNDHINPDFTDITGNTTETGVNVSGVQISIDNGDWTACSASDGAFDSASESYTCSLTGLAEGSHSIRVRSYDVNNVYIPSTLYATDDFIVDTTFPTGTISINSDETITNTDEVTLTLSATDNLSGISKMMVSNKVDYSGGTWETYNTSKEWRLSMGDGEKRVYVKYRDEVGNISSSNSDSIEMDMGAPTGTLIINEGEEYTSSREVVLHITGEDLPAQAGEVTGVEEMRISEDRTMEGVDWEGYETSREYTLSEGDGYKVIYIQYRDGIGNESEVYGSNITLDSNTEIEVTEIGEEEVEGEITNWETEETTPTFTGEGEVGATITIAIEEIETGMVIVNEDGVWSWTPSIELTRGQEYNLTITSTDLAGNEDIQTFTLGISDEEVIDVNQTTPEAQITTTQLPNTGVMIIIGLMVMGGLIWTGVNFKVIRKLR